MSEYIKIAALVLTPFLVLGALLYFTRRSQKRQFYVVMPILFAAALWQGFSNHWHTSDDFVQLGIVLCLSVVGCFTLVRASARK